MKRSEIWARPAAAYERPMKSLLLVLAVAALSGTALAEPIRAELKPDRVSVSIGEEKSTDVGSACSWVSVGFCLLTHAPFQFVAYYDAERRMTVAQRRLDEKKWKLTRLDSTLGWDSHNYVTLSLDRDAHLHVSGNMHGVPLVYFRSERPLDASSLQRIEKMTGQREARVTYPVFLRDKSGRLIFRYRDGGSGQGDDLYNVYDERSRAWQRLHDGPLLSGAGAMNAYASVPERGPDGRFHMVWVWRDTGDCATNHDLSYARSDDLAHWTDSAGRPLALPITLKTGEIVDCVPPGGGLLNVNRELGFDNAGRPIITYQKYGADGSLDIYAARREAAGWKIVRVSDWKGYRWDFSGGGTIVTEVKVGAVQPIGAGRLTLAYRSGRGSGTWVLDEATLQPIPGATPPKRPDALPHGMAALESTFPGMHRRVAADSGSAPSGGRYVLTWETLEANRDRPRPEPLPAPTVLRVVRIEATDAIDNAAQR